MQWSPLGRMLAVPSMAALVGFHLSTLILQAQEAPAPPPEAIPAPLQSVATQLQRLVQTNPSIEQPVAVLMRPFQSPSCVTSPAMSSDVSALCLRPADLPAALAQSPLAAYVLALRMESDPTTDPQLDAAVISDRTIVLNADRATPGTSTTDGTVCALSRELAAIELGQPEGRHRRLEQIDAQLAGRIRSVTERLSSTKGQRELAQFLLSPLLTAITQATAPKVSDPTSATFLRSSHWRLLQSQAPPVAAALEPLAGLPKDLAQRGWQELDAPFAFALLDREALLNQLRQQSQNQALILLAHAGIDPGPCAAQFVPPPSAETLEASSALYKATASGRVAALPRPLIRYNPVLQQVIITPGRPRSLVQPGQRLPPAP